MTIVYVLVSCGKDLYYEQALLSLYSLRLYNPDIDAVVLTDDTTEATLKGKRNEIRKYAKIKTVSVPEEYTAKERSRYIKTTLRKELRGNLLFIDTDTVITAHLGDVEDTDADIACVLDYHSSLDHLIEGPKIRDKIFNIFGKDVSDEKQYFNSGVIFLKDNLMVHTLFAEWHNYWKYSTFEKGQCYDQPALLMADIKCGHMIKELDGIYNCQILTSFQYLHKAKIIHFFNNVWEGKAQLSPFFQDWLYREIKESGTIPEHIRGLVADCKSAFCSPAYYTAKQQVEFFSTFVGATCYSLYKKNNLTYKLLKQFCKARYSIAKVFNRK